MDDIFARQWLTECDMCLISEGFYYKFFMINYRFALKYESELIHSTMLEF